MIAGFAGKYSEGISITSRWRLSHVIGTRLAKPHSKKSENDRARGSTVVGDGATFPESSALTSGKGFSHPQLGWQTFLFEVPGVA
jgi:hypothetical protein